MARAERLTERPKPRAVSAQNFWRRLAEFFPVWQVYYPGCGEDRTLEKAFGTEEVVNLDSFRLERKSYVRADFTKPPFKDEVFDVVFIQDIHAEYNELWEILRTLKNGGLVVYGLDDCGPPREDLEILEGLRFGLRKVELPFFHREYRIFQKKISPIGR